MERLIEEHHLTQSAAAATAGMSRQHIWRVLDGRSEFSADEFARLALAIKAPDVGQLAELYWEGRDRSRARKPWLVHEAVARRHAIVHDMAGVPQDSADPALANRGGAGDGTRGNQGSYARTTGPERHVSEGSIERELPRALRSRAKRFEAEALDAGADEHEMRYITSVLYNPEAIYREGGYVEPLTEEDRLIELDAAIEMLRVWLERHRARRLAVERAAR